MPIEWQLWKTWHDAAFYTPRARGTPHARSRPAVGSSRQASGWGHASDFHAVSLEPRQCVRDPERGPADRTTGGGEEKRKGLRLHMTHEIEPTDYPQTSAVRVVLKFAIEHRPKALP